MGIGGCRSSTTISVPCRSSSWRWRSSRGFPKVMPTWLPSCAPRRSQPWRTLLRRSGRRTRADAGHQDFGLGGKGLPSTASADSAAVRRASSQRRPAPRDGSHGSIDPSGNQRNNDELDRLPCGTRPAALKARGSSGSPSRGLEVPFSSGDFVGGYRLIPPRRAELLPRGGHRHRAIPSASSSPAKLTAR